MANTTTTTVIQGTGANERRYIFTFSVTGNGSGDLSNVRMNATSGDMGLNPRLRRFVGSNSGFTANVAWEATTNVNVAEVPSNNGVDYDFKQEGGVPNLAGAGKTGNLVISTNGLANNLTGTYFCEVIRSTP